MSDTDDITYFVVANHQEQYSIWPEGKEIPSGWAAVGPAGKKSECLAYIERVWTDMRPKSLRDTMRGEATQGDAVQAEISADLRKRVEGILTEHAARVEEYAGGRPELYGWFVARVLEAASDLEPEVARRGIDAVLPAHKVPDAYR